MMLTILEQSSTRLILNDNRRGLRLLAVIFTLFSLFSLVVLLAQGYQRLTDPHPDDLLLTRRVALLIFVLVGIGLTGFGVFVLFNLSRGVTLILDRTTATATLSAAHSLRQQTREYPIYAISHFQVETSRDLHAYGLFMVLRSGQSIPLATFPEHEQPHLEELLRTLRAFLR